MKFIYQQGRCSEILVKLKTWIKNNCKNIFQHEFLNFEKIVKVQNKVEEKFLNAFLVCFILFLASNYAENSVKLFRLPCSLLTVCCKHQCWLKRIDTISTRSLVPTNKNSSVLLLLRYSLKNTNKFVLPIISFLGLLKMKSPYTDCTYWFTIKIINLDTETHN